MAVDAAQRNRVRVAGVRILLAADERGAVHTLALSEKEPRRAYLLLRGKDNAWGCDCFMAKWKGRCAHVEAAELHDEDGEAGR